MLCQKENNIRLFNKEILCSSIFHRIFLSFLPSLFFVLIPITRQPPSTKNVGFYYYIVFCFCFFKRGE